MSSKELPLGVLIIGSKGAVATTLLAARAVSQHQSDFEFVMPSQVDPAFQHIPFRPLKDLVLGGWDIVDDSYSASCRAHGVVPKHLVPEISDSLDSTAIYPAILAESDQTIEGLLDRTANRSRSKSIDYSANVFTKRPFSELVKSIELDIEDFRKKNQLKKVVLVNLASTEKSVQLGSQHEELTSFEKALANNDPTITTGMLYAYAGIRKGCHFVNFTPSITFEIPALEKFAAQQSVCLSGRDGKTGQTLYKTAVAPMLKYRGLQLAGWYSTNILGNRDGEVLNDPSHRETKIQSKAKALEHIMGHSDFDHQVHIHYYKPRGDSKEAWDNIDFRGWFDVQMQMKIDWQGDDSILAAPLVADLVRWTDFFSSRGESGVLSQLASYFKFPAGTTEHDFFKQLDLLRSHVTGKYPSAQKHRGVERSPSELQRPEI